MLFVFDENFSKHMAAALHLLEKSAFDDKSIVDVTSAELFMGKKGATDPQLYEAVGKANGIVFTKDKDFRHIKLYEKVIEEHRAKVLFFRSSKKVILFWDILTVIVNRWQYIKEKMDGDCPPYVYEFDINGGISPRPF